MWTWARPVGSRWWRPTDQDGTELLLEPDAHPAAKPFKEALVSDGIPYTSFAVADAVAEFDRLRSLGVRFTQEPAAMGPGDDGRAGRHLRQPDPDRQPKLTA